MIKTEQVDTNRAEILGQILELYMRGKTPQRIADILLLTKAQVNSTLASFRKDYLSTLSIRGIIPRYQHLKEPIDEINKPFFALMSNPDEPLSNEEMLYCAFYVATGNSLEALVKSGMDVGLDKGTTSIYDSNCLLRSEMLKRKKNIQEEIRRLQVERQEHREITKDRILEMHLDMIEQLKDEGNPKNRTHIVKLLDQVNKMQGNYTTVIKTGELDADDLLDGMLAIFEEEQNVSERQSEGDED